MCPVAGPASSAAVIIADVRVNANSGVRTLPMTFLLLDRFDGGSDEIRRRRILGVPFSAIVLWYIVGHTACR
jgi:hypothetical protein